jgi:hypothetical protein
MTTTLIHLFTLRFRFERLAEIVLFAPISRQGLNEKHVKEPLSVLSINRN